MELNKVVARLKDGNTLKGSTTDFFPNKNQFHLTLTNGDVVDINVDHLKALFYVKDFEGNNVRDDAYNDNIPGGGRQIKVEFFDDEILIGFTQSYTPNRIGFFVIPADTDNNNDRVFVITSATKKVSFV